MSKWKGVYDGMTAQRYDAKLKIIGIKVEERDEVVLSLIPFHTEDTFRLMDLGAGTGRLTWKLRAAFPHAHIVAVDGSPTMLDIARTRFVDRDGIDFVLADFGQASWVDAVSGVFDVIVSASAIRHVPDLRKRQLFGEL